MTTDGQGKLVELEHWGEAKVIEVEGPVDGIASSILMSREGDSVVAYLNTCPHAGRRLDWAPGQFLISKDGLLVCAAHGASFEIGSGECVAGPCRGQSLLNVPVDVRDGAVFLKD